MKKEYSVKVFENKNEIKSEDLEKGNIDVYAWSDAYTPEAYFKLAYVKNEGFYLYLRCKEKNPRSECEGYMSPVYTDSCLEFFADYAGSGYINIECNSNGACLIAYGEGRGNRTPLLQIAEEIPAVQAVCEGDFWGVNVFISIDILRKVYGDIEISSGYEFYGNAYKCGDKCEIPHYGTWNRIDNFKPDFHRPEFFGKFILV